MPITFLPETGDRTSSTQCETRSSRGSTGGQSRAARRAVRQGPSKARPLTDRSRSSEMIGAGSPPGLPGCLSSARPLDVPDDEVPRSHPWCNCVSLCNERHPRGPYFTRLGSQQISTTSHRRHWSRDARHTARPARQGPTAHPRIPSRPGRNHAKRLKQGVASEINFWSGLPPVSCSTPPAPVVASTLALRR